MINNAEQYKADIRRFLEGIDFNYFAVYRPKNLKISYKNADALMDKTIARYELLDFQGSMDYLFFTIEEDRWNSRSKHMNILIKGENVNRLQLALSMERREKEIGYFQPISNKRACSTYVTKHIGKKGLSLGHVGLITKDPAVHKQLFGELDSNLEHPNKEYHWKQQFASNLQFQHF